MDGVEGGDVHCVRVGVKGKMKNGSARTAKEKAEEMRNRIVEQMQLCGEVDRIKEWMMCDLESSGWASTVFEKAEQIYVRGCVGDGEGEKKKSSGASTGAVGKTMSVASVSGELAKQAIGRELNIFFTFLRSMEWQKRERGDCFFFELT